MRQVQFPDTFHRIAKSSLLLTVPLSLNHSSSLVATHHMESIGSSTIMKTALNIPTVNLSTLHEMDATISLPTWIPELGKSLKQGAAGKILRIQKESQVPLQSMSLVPLIPCQPNTTWSISNLLPHCHAGDRICLWKPKMVRMFCSTQGVPIPLDQEDIELIKGVSLNSLQPSN